MRLVLDTGALIALERNERSMWRRLKAALLADEVPLTHGGVVAQAWRGGSRQAALVRALGAIEVRGVDERIGRETGALLGKARATDVVDAAVVVIAEDGDQIVTSDPEDIAELARVADREIEIIEV
jgi:hypothetical protein